MEIRDEAHDIHQIDKALIFEQYLKHTEALVKEGKTSGMQQSDNLIHYTRLNFQRMKRLNKTFNLQSSLAQALQEIADAWIWVVITETWCGDAAQNLPAMAHMAASSNHIDMRIIFRDEHPDIMDRFTTNGARSIPKLICLRKKDGQVLGTWGPRPAKMQQMVLDYKKNPETSYDVFSEKLQRVYLEDQNHSIQEEFENLIVTWQERSEILRYS
ncbi:MAG: thioredoxin family protein [Cyclobacteriaceae bacterium]|nr:thioredoxin family protein [Cyclobacteriaceae bacterium]